MSTNAATLLFVASYRWRGFQPRRLRRTKMTNETIEYEIGSGNVFKDLEVPKTHLIEPQGNLKVIIWSFEKERSLKRSGKRIYG